MNRRQLLLIKLDDIFQIMVKSKSAYQGQESSTIQIYPIYNTELVNTKRMRGQFFEENWNWILDLQNFLTKHQYFCGDCLPGVADALMFQIFDKEFPDRRIYPFIHHWFINIKQFSSATINNWKIKSKKDWYYLSLLKRYHDWEECESGTLSLRKSQRTTQDKWFSPDRKLKETHVYVIELRFKQPMDGAPSELQKHIEQKSKIIYSENIAGLTKTKLRQLIKGQLRKCKEISCFGVKMEKGKVFRAQTLTSS